MSLSTCAFCYEKLTYADPDALRVTLETMSGRGVLAHQLDAVTLTWHKDTCAVTDELHQKLADALCLPDGTESDQAAVAAYRAIHARASAAGRVREVVDVVRDTARPGWTLRHPQAWGLMAPRARRKK